MFATAEKTKIPSATVQQGAARGTFFRKAIQESIIGPAEPLPFFSPALVQPKLSVSHPDDPQEREADSVADSVMRAPDTAPAVGEGKEEEKVQPKEEEGYNRSGALFVHSTELKARGGERRPADQPSIYRSASGGEEDSADSGEDVVSCKAEDLPLTGTIQRSGRGPPNHHLSFEQRLASTKGSGQPLPADTLQRMEERFGADFSAVRIHANSTSEGMATQIHAQAFTHGADIYFNAGKFSPQTYGGGFLLAHELTHTIQQGAVPSSKTISRIHRNKTLQRSASGVPPQLTAAVDKAKSKEGKINANREGPDGYRQGWADLVDIFKTTFGEDKIVSGAGGANVRGAVSEKDIKKKRLQKNVLVVDPSSSSGTRYGERDAMPSWCGIFVFWALNKSGVPMPKWQLGRNPMNRGAAYPPGHVPQPGDIAYRAAYSHFAIVESASGGSVRTVNGNTAGEDNLGGQVQSREHPISSWSGFFNPLLVMEGSLGTGEAVAPERAKSADELQQQVFPVNRKEGDGNVAGATTNGVAQPKMESVDAGRPEGSKAEPKINEGETEEKYLPAVNEGLHFYTGTEPARLNEMVSRKQEIPTLKESLSSSVPTQVPNNASADTRSLPLPGINTSMAEKDVETKRGPPVTIQRSWLGDAWDAVGDAVNSAVEWAENQLNEAKAWILEQIASFVSNIPGYRLLTVILRHDPVTGRNVERTGANLLSAGLQLLGPLGGIIETLLRRTNTFDEAAGFVERSAVDLSTTLSSIRTRFSQFINGLSIGDIRHPQQVLNNVADLLRGVIADITSFIRRTAEDFLGMVKRVMIREVVGFVRRHIPRLYPLLTVILGHDPVTDETVPRNGTTILNALFDVTDEGREQRRQLLETGTFQRVAAWIDRGIHVFNGLYTAIRSGFGLVWNAVRFESLLHPVETFQQIYNHFAAPVADAWAFVRDTARIIIDFIKEALLRRLSRWARDQRGYFLITLLIHRDPFTGDAVPFTVENVIHAFMSLMEGGEEQFQQMRQSGAIARTVNRVMAAVARLNFTLPYIVGLFTGLWRSFRLSDLANPIGVFRRVIGTLAVPVRRLIAFVIEIVRIVIEVILQLMQFPTEVVANIIARAMQAWEQIKRDPIGFLKNLLRAIKQGFIQFFNRVSTHLLNGLVGWLMSELRDANVPAPTDFTLRGIIGWVLQVLGISMDAIWQKLAQHPRIGAERVARIRSMIDRLEGIWTFIRDVQQRGIAAIWDKIQEQLSNLWNTVIDAIKNWIMERIVSQVTARLLSMLDPTGIMAVINSAIAIYRAVQSFVRYLRQMLEVVNSFVSGLADVAQGNIVTAANYLENTMDRAMPVVIGFLANQVGLSGIGRRVAEMIGRVREMVDRALTWLVNRAVDTAFSAVERLLSLGRSAVSAIAGWARRLLGLEKRFTAEDQSSHRLFFREAGTTVVLMINPDPAGTFETWIASIVPDTSTAAGQQRALKKTQATAKARQIDAKKAETVSGATDADRQAAERQKETEIRNMLDELSALAGPLFTGQRPPCASDGAGLTFGGLHNGLYGSSMRATYLTNNRMPAGSVPSVAHTPSYRVINQRRYQAGSYYILGHLLNHNIGGTGADWRNLTPLTREANSAHERIVEARVKRAVDAGNIVTYSVQAVYGRGAANSTDPQIQEIMNEERHVPLRLICGADVVTLHGTSVVSSAPLVPAGTVIENTVEQTASAYQLTAMRREPVYLDSNDKSKFESIPGVNSVFAEKIVVAWREKMTRDRTRFASFDALSNYVFNDGSVFSAQQKSAFRRMPILGYVHLFET